MGSPSAILLHVTPSQNGAWLESLQPQTYMRGTFSSKLNVSGLNAVPLWCYPSQKGCFFDIPHEHQW